MTLRGGADYRSEESKIIEYLFERLMTSNKYPFPKSQKRLCAPAEHGVYVIWSREDVVLHVGRTIRGKAGLRQRLLNHLHNQSSFSVYYLDKQGQQLREGHTFQYLLLPDDRQRALLEHLAVARLCPKHLGLGSSEGQPTNIRPQ